MDLIIRNGKIIDGTGKPSFKADIGIMNGKIVKMGKLYFQTEKIIDAEGMVVCPGFIDIHSHSDFTLLANPKAESSIRQGVTTVVTGNCGISPVPLKRKNNLISLKRYVTPIKMGVELEWDWTTFGEYFNKLKRRGIGVNVAPLVGHGVIRIAVMGFDNRRPSREELEEMKELTAESMEDGAFGLSTGLTYPPGCYADTCEIIELCKIVARYGGIYASHIRSESSGLFDAVREAIEIGQKAGIPVEISHHKAAGRSNWGKIRETLRMIDEARMRGMDVTYDFYPYTAAMTLLNALLPDWVYEGGPDKLVERVKDVKNRERIKREIEEGIPGWWNPIKDLKWEDIRIAYCDKDRKLEGKSVKEIAELKSKDPHDIIFDLLIKKTKAWVLLFMMDEEDILTLMKHPIAMIGSDSFSVAPYGPLSSGKPHPRYYGTYPRFLGKYVRDEGVLTLEEAICKMTSLPAQRIGLENRGLVREGMWADIVIFNSEKIIDKADYIEPHQYPEGIEYVLVNGQIEIEREEHTGILSGRVLHKSVG